LDGQIAMNTGTIIRTASYIFSLYWEPAGANTDLNMGGRLGRWVRQNETAIDKLKSGVDAIKLLTEQFPTLTLVEVRHSNGLLARWQK
jgi:hypothetical protein